MPQNITDATTWTATLTAPADGDAVDADDFIGHLQGLANRSKYLYAHSMVARTQIQLPLTNSSIDSRWTYSVGYFINTDTSAAAHLGIELGGLVPPGATLTEVKAFLNGGEGGAHAGVPANKPKIGLYEIDPTDGSFDYTIEATDPSASTGAYDVDHTITVAVERTVSKDKRYLVEFVGESGANASNGKLALWGISVSWTAP